jgi:predicted phage terminase large subunit-like protein
MTSGLVKLTAELVESFAGAYLSPRYDSPVPTPRFHREAWKLYCDSGTYASVVAPRGHAKSTALTHDYGLASVLFRDENYVLIVSATEDLAIGHLGDIAKELRENEDLIRDFQIDKLTSDAKTDVICRFKDGHECRFVAKGSGQKLRGMKWNGQRPGLILCDDLEDDEQVENRDRRRKFSRWFNRALLPCIRRGGKIRYHGTILHEDSQLSRIHRKSRSKDAVIAVWKTLFYRAHLGFDDFSEILWPEQFSEERLRAVRQQFIDDGDASGYSQEYLNDPFDSSEAYLRKDDFLPMEDEHERANKHYVLGCDFAVSKADRANRTSFTIGGRIVSGDTCIVDQEVGRWDTEEWIDVMFRLEERYKPETWYVEDGVIWKAVAPTIYREMRLRSIFLNIYPILPVKDKATRGRAFQKRMRAGAVRFAKDASWYEEYEAELLRFTGYSEALLDDQFDSTAIMFKGLDVTAELEPEDDLDEEELEIRQQAATVRDGRSKVTGY